MLDSSQFIRNGNKWPFFDCKFVILAFERCSKRPHVSDFLHKSDDPCPVTLTCEEKQSLCDKSFILQLVP